MSQDQYTRLIFGVKLRIARQKKSLSLAVLSERSGLSTSYLNEIENGKKYPKEEKASDLAKALEMPLEELTELTLPRHLEPLASLLRSGFLEEVPFHLFGIDVAKIVEIVANAPMRVSAFISALIEIARQYEFRQENFFFAALRSYQKLFDNYFPEWEKEVEHFIEQYEIDISKPVDTDFLYNIIYKKYKYKIDKTTLAVYPELRGTRSVFIPEKKKLYLNSQLDEVQEKFILSKEIAYKFLNLKERVTTSNFIKVKNFEQAVHNFKTSYFAGALLINRDSLIKDIENIFKEPYWSEDFILNLLERYRVSAEMLFQRLTNLLPTFFGLKDMFFLRFDHSPGTEIFTLTKELHLGRHHQPHSKETDEHYCRRWLALKQLKDLQKLQRNKQPEKVSIDIQRSKYIGSDDEYLVITLARSGHPTPNSNISVTLGFAVNETLKKQVNFLSDPNISTRFVGTTCERCSSVDCQERIFQPIVIEAAQRRKKIEDALKSL